MSALISTWMSDVLHVSLLPSTDAAVMSCQFPPIFLLPLLSIYRHFQYSNLSFTPSAQSAVHRRGASFVIQIVLLLFKMIFFVKEDEPNYEKIV